MGEEEYVNPGPENQRCEYTFVNQEQLNWPGKDGGTRVILPRGMKCGLEKDPTSNQGYCYWHKTDPSKAKDQAIRQKLESAVRKRYYLGSVFLSGEGPGTRLVEDFGPLDLSGAKLDGAYLTGAYLERACLRGTSLRDAHLMGAWLANADLTGANLSGSYLQGANLESASLEGAALWEAEIEGSRLDSVYWGDYVLQYEKQGKFDWEEVTYRTLKQHRESNGDYGTAGEFYFRERECRRKWHRQYSWWAGTSDLFLKLLLGYGERPTWTLWWVGGVILFWGGVVFPLVGIHNPDGTTSQLSWPPSLDPFKHGISLSLITFATLGYGNRYPASPLGEFLAGCEAVLGMVLGSIFVASFARKVIRG